METRNCTYCGAPVTRRASQFTAPRAYCNFACKGLDARKETIKARRLVKAPGHPLASHRGYVLKARFLLYERIGPGTHPCHWCGQSVTWMMHTRIAPGALVADHLDRDPYHDATENIVAACQGCNATRHNRIKPEEPVFTRSNGRRRRGVPLNCDHCGSAFIGEPLTGLERKRRFCSQVCYWAAKKGRPIPHLTR